MSDRDEPYLKIAIEVLEILDRSDVTVFEAAGILEVVKEGFLRADREIKERI